MIVSFSTAELKNILHDSFPELASGRASLRLIDESFILFQESPYRRVWFQYDDAATVNMHGSCFQAISLWFKPSGELSQTFVSKMECPI